MDLSKLLFSHCSLSELSFKEECYIGNEQGENGVGISLEFATDAETSKNLKITASLRVTNPETGIAFFIMTIEAYYNNDLNEKINVEEFSDEDKQYLTLPIWNEASYLFSVITKSAYKVPNIIDFAEVLQDLTFDDE